MRTIFEFESGYGRCRSKGLWWVVVKSSGWPHSTRQSLLKRVAEFKLRKQTHSHVIRRELWETCPVLAGLVFRM